MKKIFIICLGLWFGFANAVAQGVVPKAKTKAEQREANKKKTLEQRIEDVLPVDVALPKPNASISLPGENNISSVEDAKKFLNESLPNLATATKNKSKKAKKAIQKAKADIFDGKQFEKIAIEKKIFKKGSGSKLVYQEFYVLKNHQAPSPYHKALMWWDEKNQKTVEAIARDTKTNRLMHGPFKEFRGETLVNEGFYYLGAKHSRWISYDKDFNLTEKETYHKGFYEESIITYFDNDSLKIKEVLPQLYGKRMGNYYRFNEDATLAEEGKYDDGKKIGKWVEYFPGGNRRKKETQYPHDWLDTTAPYLIREYDPSGKLIYDYANKK
jgi:antitoxin component YwqK of YwqJK toxin-antitoxin module